MVVVLCVCVLVCWFVVLWVYWCVGVLVGMKVGLLAGVLVRWFVCSFVRLFPCLRASTFLCFYVSMFPCLFLSSSLTRDAEACARSSNGGRLKNSTTRPDRKIAVALMPLFPFFIRNRCRSLVNSELFGCCPVPSRVSALSRRCHVQCVLNIASTI